MGGWGERRGFRCRLVAFGKVRFQGARPKRGRSDSSATPGTDPIFHFSFFILPFSFSLFPRGPVRKELTFQRLSLLAMALGLVFIVQPWSQGVFAIGFPFTLAAIVAYNVAGWAGGDRAEKVRDDDKRKAEAGA
jgi:hypothetical protein